MGLREPFDTAEPTHTVVTRTSEVWNEEDTGWIDVENAVVEVAIRYGTAVHFRINKSELSEYDPNAATIVRERFERMDENECVLDREKYLEFRATLPDDADAVIECLAIRDDDTWLGRLYGLYEFAVVRDETWLYHSIPHESYLQDFNGDGVDGFLEEAATIVDSKPKFGVFPAGSLVSWEADGRRYELDPGSKSLGFEDLRSGKWSGFNIGGLVAIHPVPERFELVCRWRKSSETDLLTLRGLGWVFDRFTTNPPTRIGVPDRETLDDVLEAFRTVATKLDYGLTVHG
jgi:hypothetical protein